jgi:hypothetical protein
VLDVPTRTDSGFTDISGPVAEAVRGGVTGLVDRIRQTGEDFTARIPTLFSGASAGGISSESADAPAAETSPFLGLPQIPGVDLSAIRLPEIPGVDLSAVRLPEIPGVDLSALRLPFARESAEAPGPESEASGPFRLPRIDLSAIRLPELRAPDLASILSTDLPGPFIETPEVRAPTIDLSQFSLDQLRLPTIEGFPQIRIELPFLPRSEEEAEQVAQELAAEASEALSVSAAPQESMAPEQERGPFGLPRIQLPELPRLEMPSLTMPFGRQTASSAEQPEVTVQSVDGSSEQLPIEAQQPTSLRERLMSAADPNARLLPALGSRPLRPVSLSAPEPESAGIAPIIAGTAADAAEVPIEAISVVEEMVAPAVEEHAGFLSRMFPQRN